MQINGVIIIVIVAALAGAWLERDTLKKHWQQQFPSQQIEASQTQVYSWKDSDGTMHYSSHADDKRAKEMTVDTARITRLEPLPPKKDAAKEQGKLMIMEMREELERNRDKMQQAREKQVMNE